MKRSPYVNWSILGTLAVVLLTAPLSQGALINPVLAPPIISYDSNGQITFDAGTGQFNVDATPLTVTFPDSSFAFVDAPRALRIRLLVDGGGVASSNGGTDDLVIEGSIDADGDTVVDYSGTLLTGKIHAFGFLDTGTAVDSFDFLFDVTGGSMAALFTGGRIGVTLTSENSTFADSFLTHFAGKAKGNVGLVPCDARIGGAVKCPNRCGKDAPIAGATVTITNASDVVVATLGTDADGRYSLADLPAGDYTITVTPPDGFAACGPDSRTVTLACDECKSVDFCVCPLCESTIRGTVKCTSRCKVIEKIPGVAVEVYDDDDQLVGTATTDADGEYEIGGLPPGKHVVKIIVPDGYSAGGSTRECVYLRCGQDKTVDFRVCPICATAAVEGTVKCYRPSKAVSGVVVTLYDEQNNEAGSFTTGDDGRYRFENLAEGKYTVKIAVPSGYKACGSTRSCVTLSCDRCKTVDFCVCKDCR